MLVTVDGIQTICLFCTARPQLLKLRVNSQSALRGGRLQRSQWSYAEILLPLPEEVGVSPHSVRRLGIHNLSYS